MNKIKNVLLIFVIFLLSLHCFGQNFWFKESLNLIELRKEKRTKEYSRLATKEITEFSLVKFRNKCGSYKVKFYENKTEFDSVKNQINNEFIYDTIINCNQLNRASLRTSKDSFLFSQVSFNYRLYLISNNDTIDAYIFCYFSKNKKRNCITIVQVDSITLILEGFSHAGKDLIFYKILKIPPSIELVEESCYYLFKAEKIPIEWYSSD